MKIVIVADSHGDNETLNLIALKHQDADLFIHAGDSESNEYSIKPFISVRGNCDYYPDFQDNLMIPTPLGNIHVSHKPPFTYEIKEKNAKFFIYGHIHCRKNEKIYDKILLNPGAISYARDGFEPSYAILNIDKDGYKIEFFTAS